MGHGYPSAIRHDRGRTNGAFGGRAVGLRCVYYRARWRSVNGSAVLNRAPARPARWHDRAVLRISDDQRRARLQVRHGLHPHHRFASVEDLARGVVALHATDPATIVLQAWARIDGFQAADLERALYDDRTLIKHMAMRRTLFVVHREGLPAMQAGASERVAGQERGRVSRDVEKAGLEADGAAWLAGAEADVLAALAGGREASSTELRDELPSLQRSIHYAPHKSWGGMQPQGPRVMTALSAAGKLVRTTNQGTWTSSRPLWGLMDDWLGEPLVPPTTDEGVRALVEGWLRAFGPGTTADIKWWLGGTVKATKQALAELEAVEVDLDGGIGWVLPDDTDEIDDPGPAAALLPSLDLTTMGWFERPFYLGEYRPQLFDSNGNGGPSAWWNGRIVGGWRPAPGGGDRIELQLLEDPGKAARTALEAEAKRLGEWLADIRFVPRFPSPLSKAP
ncbi:MAG: AlkZ family DNA glycosylase [Solirubrobacteraceae bacterium]|nr:AlkZ family DNA glycosylase [Solirubrobacteraceae bacterium]